MITQIIWLFSWPVLIALSYYVIRKVLEKVEKNDDRAASKNPL
jgi:hypothetical protein